MNSTVTYGVTEEIYSLRSDSRTAYGIAAYSEIDGTATVLLTVHDVTSDKEKLQTLADTCNRLSLSALHLLDAVEDFLAG